MRELKLFELESGETDWWAAYSEAGAKEMYRKHYGLSASEMHDVTVSVIDDPSAVSVDTDEVDVETEETITKTAAEVMAGMKKPGFVASTVY